jgi:hypothetical protein
MELSLGVSSTWWILQDQSALINQVRNKQRATEEEEAEGVEVDIVGCEPFILTDN